MQEEDLNKLPSKHPFENILLNEGLLNQIINNADTESFREHSSKNSERRYALAILIIVLLFILGLVYLLANKNSELLMKIITSVITLVTGAFGGYGLGYKKGKSESDS